MRIVGGQFRGRQIRAPKNLPVRPTTDLAKEALFNILQNWYDFEDLKVLELFAGTGNISYEFLSRGVEDLTAVDQHAGCFRFIKSTLKVLGARAKVVRSDAKKFIKHAEGPYDLIFMDPPYGMEGLEDLVALCFKRELLSGYGTLVLEHPPQENYSEQPFFSEQRVYGSSVFSFFEKE